MPNDAGFKKKLQSKQACTTLGCSVCFAQFPDITVKGCSSTHPFLIPISSPLKAMFYQQGPTPHVQRERKGEGMTGEPPWHSWECLERQKSP